MAGRGQGLTPQKVQLDGLPEHSDIVNVFVGERLCVGLVRVSSW